MSTKSVNAIAKNECSVGSKPIDDLMPPSVLNSIVQPRHSLCACHCAYETTHLRMILERRCFEAYTLHCRSCHVRK